MKIQMFVEAHGFVCNHYLYSKSPLRNCILYLTEWSDCVWNNRIHHGIWTDLSKYKPRGRVSASVMSAIVLYGSSGTTHTHAQARVRYLTEFRVFKCPLLSSRKLRSSSRCPKYTLHCAEGWPNTASDLVHRPDEKYQEISSHKHLSFIGPQSVRALKYEVNKYHNT